MTVFLLIFLILAALSLAARFGINPVKKFKSNASLATGLTFVLTGALHFVMPGTYLQMMPAFLPAPLLLIYVSGFFEILGGIGLLLPPTRRFAAIGLVALLLCVFPANIYVALNNVQLGGFMSYALYQWLRLPMQLLLIGWVIWCTNDFSAKHST
jgi:uncharacterized membrane protein